MIKRSIILIGIEGEIPDPLPRRGVRINKEKAILLFGTVQRKENDHFKSLDLALSLKSQDRKLFVVEKTIAFDPKALHFQWEDIVPHSFDSLAQGEILLSTALASAFDRYYQIAKKQDLYLLEGVLEGTRFLRGLTKRHPVMVGREKELFELSEILEQSFEDRGQIASIIGEGGMGKTRLWLEFEKSLEKQHVLHFKAGFTLNDNQPYVGFQNLFGSLFAHFKSDLDLSPTHQAFLNYFLSPQDQHPIIAKLGAEDIKQNITETILTILSKLKDQKMVFILDDMHWADEASIGLLEKIVPQIPTTHHMWLLIHRPDFVPTFERELFFHSLTLQNLAVEQMEAQIKNILDLNYIAPSALKKIHHHSKGNPFFVEEIFRHSLDQKLIEPKTKIIQDLPLDKGIPLNIEAMIQARLDQLQTETFQTLQWLCVLGSTFLWDEAVFILDQEGFDAQTILENLQKEKYISEISAFPENRWGFYHDLIVETLRSNNIETSHFQKMNHQIGTYLVEFYQEEKHKHIERICDFLLQAPFKKDYTPLFEEAGKKAFGLNQFQKTNLYFGHLNTNQTLKHEHFSMYAQSLINTNDLNTLEDFLKTWAKIASVETEDPENGYYRYYFQFLFIQYEPQKIIYQIESVIEKYRQLYPHKTLDSLTRYQLESLGTLRKTSQLIHKGFQYLRTLNMQNSVSQYKLIPLHLISHTASDTGDQYQILSLDFVNKGMVIIQNNPSI